MSAIPEKFADLFAPAAKSFAWLATVQPDGTPQLTPVWFDVADGKIRINTAEGRVKHRNMRENGSIALGILDASNPYRYVQVRGRVVRSTHDGADAHINGLAMKYLGQAEYPFRQPGEVRVLFEVEPLSFQGNG